MKRGFVWFLVLGLSVAALGSEVVFDNEGSETKDISSKITKTSYGHNLLDKRGAVKITNADNPAFNHLSSSSSSSSSSSVASSGGFKPSTPVSSNLPPFRYLYTNQYYQPNPFVTYVQIPQAAQIAAQYAIQSNPVAHYLQTPTQIQYVAAPTVAQTSQIKYQSYPNEYSSSAAASSATSTQQYVTPSQQTQSYLASGTAATQTAASTSSASQGKQQVQVPAYSAYQTAQPVYYQQPYFTYVTPQQVSPANFVYQQPNADLLLKQQQQQLLSFYGGNRFGFYTPAQNQLTYLVPMAVTPSVQESATTDKTSEKSSPTTQHTSSNAFTYGTKA